MHSAKSTEAWWCIDMAVNRVINNLGNIFPCQYIWTNADVLLIGPLGQTVKFDNCMKVRYFLCYCTKKCENIPPAKYHPFHSSLDVNVLIPLINSVLSKGANIDLSQNGSIVPENGTLGIVGASNISMALIQYKDVILPV